MLFLPQPFAAIGGTLIILHQLVLIVGGNYSWLNWLTVFLAITAFNDQILLAPLAGLNLPGTGIADSFQATAYPEWHGTMMSVLLGVALVLSVQPTINLFKKDQLMNYSFNPLHLINTYGAFGSMSRERYEVVIEGTTDDIITTETTWREYEFKAKPGRLTRMPPQVAPYHLRLDWLMWFIPFSVMAQERRLFVPGYDLWFIRFVQKLLESDKPTLKLLANDPMEGKTPKFIRARYYLYQFTSPVEERETGAWWKRTLIGEYLPPVNLDDLKDGAAAATGRRREVRRPR